ncbi:MAG: sigma-70 family RNA polymerase sigma factor [Planctomycetes bacterium]|nr:sigma-70 family RNA polymerase sigma factor [Planctomycetota bacterium]
MTPNDPNEATRALEQMGEGDQAAAERLLPMVYSELRALAGSYFRGQPADHTLQPTALVHEAFVRLIGQTSVQWKSRAHFMAVAATAMRHILTDHARRTNAVKRGGNQHRVELTDAVALTPAGQIDLVSLEEALNKLASFDERKHRIVELRFFGGLSVDEAAEVLSVSKSTVESDWRAARAWLGVELSK